MRDRDPTAQARIPDSLQGSVEQGVELARAARVAERVREGDATLWGPPGTPEIADRLGWLTIAERMLAELGELERFADELRGEGIRDVVLLGMGGSSLAPEVLRRCFGHTDGWPALHVLDTTDASAILSLQQRIEHARTLFIVSSKSGGTIEPLSLFAHFWSLSGDGSRFIAITDPGSPLAELAQRHGFRRTFAGDPDIGGRYSALSAFGIVPGALMGADVRSLLELAPRAWETLVAQAPDGSPPESRLAGVWLGIALSALARAGRDKLTFVIAPSLPGLGLWLEQLFAESTGKQSRGILPVAEEPLGEPDEYGPDRVFAYLPDVRAPDPQLDARVQALAQAGHPLLSVPSAGPPELGRLFLLFEIVVAVAGWGLEINPFDQPNVQQAKDATNSVLAGYEQRGALPQISEAQPAALRELLLAAAPPAYVALMGYCQPSAELDQAVAELRVMVRAASSVTTTFGYGPRFLHSTGQFHKGGPRTGRFLQLLHDGPRDVEIPGKPYTFTTLKHAQAIGDLETLRSLGLPAEQVRLRGEDPAGALRALTASIKEPT